MEQVVVKVNRPRIRERIEVDTKVLLRLVPLIGRFIDKSLQFSAKSVIDQFSDTIKEEMDYRKKLPEPACNQEEPEIREGCPDSKDIPRNLVGESSHS